MHATIASSVAEWGLKALQHAHGNGFTWFLYTMLVLVEAGIMSISSGVPFFATDDSFDLPCRGCNEDQDDKRVCPRQNNSEGDSGKHTHTTQKAAQEPKQHNQVGKVLPLVFGVGAPALGRGRLDDAHKSKSMTPNEQKGDIPLCSKRIRYGSQGER